jgi:O-antigen/teichoic acid export membrane protein
MGLPADARDAALHDLSGDGGCLVERKTAAAHETAEVDGSQGAAPRTGASSGGRTLNRTAQFTLNTAANYGRMLVSIATVAVLTPFIISRIGRDDFGLWSLVISALGFLGLLDLGMGTGVIKYVAQSKASRNIDRRNRILSTLGAVYLAIVAASFAAIAVLSIFFNQIFAIPAAQQQKTATLLWILAVRFVLLAIPLSLFRNALYGEQKVYLINSIQGVATIVYAAGTWVALERGFGLLALAWMNLGAMLLEYVGYMWFAYATIEDLRISPALFDKRLLKEAASFSSAQFLINIAALVLLRTDPLVVKAFLPLSAVAIYAVALKIAENAYLLAKQFTNLLGPLAAELRENAEETKIRFVFVNCTKFAMAPGVMLAVAMYVLGRETLTFWVGQDFAAGGVVLMVLLTSMALDMPGLTSSAVLSMTGHHRITAWAAVVEVVLNVALSVALVRPLGLVGIAVGTLASTVLVDMVMTYRACQLHGVTYVSYLFRALAPALVPAVPQFGLTWAMKHWSPPDNLISTIMLTIPGAILYMLLFWFLSIERSEKDLLVSKILGRFRPLRVAAGR